MGVSLKSRRSIITPRLDNIKDPELQNVLNQFARSITDIARNVYDDLSVVGLSKVLNFTRDMTAASGDVTYSGFGFAPRNLIFIAGINAGVASSIGFADGTKNLDLRSEAVSAADQVGLQTTTCINLLSGVGVSQSAVLKAFTNDGFTLTWTKTGVPGAANGSIFCLALS